MAEASASCSDNPHGVAHLTARQWSTIAAGLTLYRNAGGLHHVPRDIREIAEGGPPARLDALGAAEIDGLLSAVVALAAIAPYPGAISSARQPEEGTLSPAVVGALIAQGFAAWDTGGGCEAYGFAGPGDSSVLITDETGCFLPSDGDWMVGAYMEAGCVGFSSADAEPLDLMDAVARAKALLPAGRAADPEA